MSVKSSAARPAILPVRERENLSRAEQVDTSVLVFRVEGVPIPQGSMKGFVTPAGHVAITSDNPKLYRWRQTVATAATVELFDGPRERRGVRFGGLLVDLAFVLPRPKSLPKRVTSHVTRPDVDKLARAVLDALTGVVWSDDAQVVGLHARKRHAQKLEQPGVWVSIGPVSQPPATLFDEPKGA